MGPTDITQHEVVGLRDRRAEIAAPWPSFRVATPASRKEDRSAREELEVLAMFCFEKPASIVGRFASKLARITAEWQTPVHLFSQQAFDLRIPKVMVHPVGECNDRDLLGSVDEFTRRACKAYLQTFPANSAKITLLGHEWSSIPAVSTLHGIKNASTVLSLHSLERQRSDLTSEASRRIEETELGGLRGARSVLVHGSATAEIIRHFLPECAERIVDAGSRIPMDGFEFRLDPGEVKARFQIGPIDPTILYVGDLDHRYGPDLLMKAMGCVLKKHAQTRCVFVGNGDLIWPLRVYSRYLLLDHAVRLVGHLGGQGLYELIHAADIVAVPSRVATPWWLIEAAWAAHRPVVATPEAAPSLLEGERDCVMVDSNEHALAAGIDRLLSDPETRRRVAAAGRKKLDSRYGDHTLVAWIQEAIGASRSREQCAG